MAQFCSICGFNSNQFSIWSIQEWTVVNIVPFRRVHELMGGNGQSGTIAIGFWRIAIQLVALYWIALCIAFYRIITHCIAIHLQHCIVTGGLVFALGTVNSRLTDWTLDGHWTLQWIDTGHYTGWTVNSLILFRAPRYNAVTVLKLHIAVQFEAWGVSWFASAPMGRYCRFCGCHSYCGWPCLSVNLNN